MSSNNPVILPPLPEGIIECCICFSSTCSACPDSPLIRACVCTTLVHSGTLELREEVAARHRAKFIRQLCVFWTVVVSVFLGLIAVSFAIVMGIDSDRNLPAFTAAVIQCHGEIYRVEPFAGEFDTGVNETLTPPQLATCWDNRKDKMLHSPSEALPYYLIPGAAVAICVFALVGGILRCYGNPSNRLRSYRPYSHDDHQASAPLLVPASGATVTPEDQPQGPRHQWQMNNAAASRAHYESHPNDESSGPSPVRTSTFLVHGDSAWGSWFLCMFCIPGGCWDSSSSCDTSACDCDCCSCQNCSCGCCHEISDENGSCCEACRSSCNCSGAHDAVWLVAAAAVIFLLIILFLLLLFCIYLGISYAFVLHSTYREKLRQECETFGGVLQVRDLRGVNTICFNENDEPLFDVSPEDLETGRALSVHQPADTAQDNSADMPKSDEKTSSQSPRVSTLIGAVVQSELKEEKPAQCQLPPPIHAVSAVEDSSLAVLSESQEPEILAPPTVILGSPPVSPRKRSTVSVLRQSLESPRKDTATPSSPLVGDPKADLKDSAAVLPSPDGSAASGVFSLWSSDSALDLNTYLNGTQKSSRAILPPIKGTNHHRESSPTLVNSASIDMSFAASPNQSAPQLGGVLLDSEARSLSPMAEIASLISGEQ